MTNALLGLTMNEKAKHVLIIDDEESIRKSLTGVFQDEGFTVSVAEDGDKGLAAINEIHPDLVLLDIWMPGRDGLEILKTIQEIDPKIPVIMISGHATIATAVRATQMGAKNFIEKPLDLEVILLAVNRALESDEQDDDESVLPKSNDKVIDDPRINKESVKFNPIVFTRKALLGDKVPQKTLARSAILYGQGLHSGKKSGLTLEPLPANSGIHFVGVSERKVVPAHVGFVESTGFATTLRIGETQVGTIEHLMSALHAYGISNLLVKCNGEVPVLDGSALEFCNLFEGTGFEEQEGDWHEIAIRKPIEVKKDREFIRVEPSESFTIEYTLNYPAPLGLQHRTFTLGDAAIFKAEIAPARTFGFVKDISYLQKQGLALGGRFDNFVLIGEQGPINTDFRFSDEPVRHKILDAIGDLYLLGRRIRGKVTASMTGHSDNIALLREINKAISEEL